MGSHCLWAIFSDLIGTKLTPFFAPKMGISPFYGHGKNERKGILPRQKLINVSILPSILPFMNFKLDQCECFSKYFFSCMM